MSNDNEAFFNRDFDIAFGQYSSEHERLHKRLWPSRPEPELSETQYFSFSIPEERIHAFLHFWYHPNLQTVCGGAVVFQGMKPVQLGVELHDYRAYMSDKVFADDLDSYCFPNSYRVSMLEVGKRYRVQYSDAERGNSFDVELEAVSEPMMWPDNRHFEQVMRTRGKLELRGKRYNVDGYSIRDRSWGEARTEVAMAGPSNSWAVGTFNPDFAFLATGTDNAEAGPIWAGRYVPEKTKPLAFGWVLDGESRSPVSQCRKKITYDRSTMTPKRIDMRLLTAGGQEYDLVGEVAAATTLALWPNVRVPVCLTKWNCNGQTGWGELQDAQWGDFLYDFAEQSD